MKAPTDPNPIDPLLEPVEQVADNIRATGEEASHTLGEIVVEQLGNLITLNSDSGREELVKPADTGTDPLPIEELKELTKVLEKRDQEKEESDPTAKT